MIAPRMIAAWFALFGTLSVLLMATLMPPFQNPDEGAHFARADQIGHLGLLGRCGPGAPALIDEGALAGAAPFGVLPFTTRHVARAMYAPAPWGGRLAACMPNTSIYPPHLYVPAALAIRLGQALGLTVLPTLEMARAATGIASVFIATIAIALSGPAAVWLFAILTLPMALAQTAAVSQDGPMMACAALAAALAMRLQSPIPRHRTAMLAVMAGAIAAMAAARPPYAAFAALPLLMPGFARWLRAVAAGAVLLVVGSWSWFGVRATRIDLGHFGAGTDARAQAAYLLYGPWRVFSVAYNTVTSYGGDYLEGMIGRLGWLDLTLPVSYIWIAWGVLALAGLAVWRGSSGRRHPRVARGTALALLAACAGMFAIQYFTWTNVGNATVGGIQGRYFLVPALIAVLLFARPLPSGSRLAAVASCLVLLFPIASLVVTLHRVLLRYYL